MAKPRNRGLGRGLSALLDENNLNETDQSKITGKIFSVPISQIETNPFQPRTKFKPEPLEELAESIKSLGIIQPLTVRRLSNSQFQLVSGERRLRAASLAGLDSVPAYVRTANDQEMLEMALVENIQRQELDPIEIALSYQRMGDELDLKQEEISSRVGKKRSTISNYLRLLKLNPMIQSGIRDEMISMGHGRALINIEDPEKQLDIYEKIIASNLSVRDTENLVKEAKSENPKKEISKASKKKTASLKPSKELSNYFEKPTEIEAKDRGKSKIVIYFKNKKELNSFVQDLLEK